MVNLTIIMLLKTIKYNSVLTCVYDGTEKMSYITRSYYYYGHEYALPLRVMPLKYYPKFRNGCRYRRVKQNVQTSMFPSTTIKFIETFQSTKLLCI